MINAARRNSPVSKLPIPHGCSAGVLTTLLLLFLAIFSASALAMTIRVSPDRNPVAVNESFRLVFSADQKPDDDPDFSPLERDFEILNQGQSSQVSIVNGSFSRKTEWTLALMPKQTGTFTIPAISFGSDRSEEITVTVQAAAEEEASAGPSELMLEVQAEPRNPYVQAQVRYTVRVLRRVNFSGAELSEPVVHDALVERLGEDRGYQAQRGGQQYAVIERQYAIFPQKSGPLKIDPLNLEAQIPGSGRSRFNSFFGQGTRVARVQSKAVELNVRPIPPAFTGKHWLPAESVELTESWSQSPPETSVGEPITRTLNLRAKGATVGVLPELDAELSRSIGDHVKLYPDQPALNEEKRADGIVSSRQEKTAILSGKAGAITLPAVEIPWWNTRSDRMEIARLPERTLAVTGPANGPTPTNPTTQEQARAQQNQDERSDKAEPVVSQVENGTTDLITDPWFWSSMAGFLGWLLTAVAWMLSRRLPRKQTPVTRADSNMTLRAACKALKSACDSNDPIRVRDALIAWAQARWPKDRPEQIQTIAERVGGEFADHIRGLERRLYGRSDGLWSAGILWELAAADEAKAEKGPAPSPPGLEPLYRS